MTYATGTIAASATPNTDLMLALHTTILAGGLTYVEEFIAGTDVTRVYKSAAASNAVADWWLYVRRANVSGGIHVTVSEAWDATGKKIQKYIPAGTATPNASYQVPDATGLAPNNIPGSIYGTPLSTNTTGFQYWISANPVRVCFATRVGTSDAGIYAGLYEEFLPAAVLGSGVELGCADIAGALTLNQHPTNTKAGYTREPNQAGANAGNFAGGPSANNLWGFSGSTADVYTGKFYMCRLIAWGRGGPTNPRGITRDVYYTASVGATPVNGDTLTSGSKTLTRMGGLWVDQGV